MDKLKNHSKEFLAILKKGYPVQAIRSIIDKKPLLVFWVTPEGEVLDAKNAHFDNPPNGDKTVLGHKNFKGRLRGRAAYIGVAIYIVIYGRLNRQQRALLMRSYPKIIRKIIIKNKLDHSEVYRMHFINGMGNKIL